MQEKRQPHAKRNPFNKDEYFVDEEGAVTRCVCGNHAPNGFMLQCEDCAVWQHGVCVGISHVRASPKHYFCEMCRPENHPYSTNSLLSGSSTPKRSKEAKTVSSLQKKRRSSVVEATNEVAVVSPIKRGTESNSDSSRAKKRKSIELDIPHGIIDGIDSQVLTLELLQSASGNMTELGRRRTRNPKPTYHFEDAAAQSKAQSKSQPLNVANREAQKRTSKNHSPIHSRAASTTPSDTVAALAPISPTQSDRCLPPHETNDPERGVYVAAQALAVTEKSTAHIPTPTSEPVDTSSAEVEAKRSSESAANQYEKALEEIRRQHFGAVDKLPKIRCKSYSANTSLPEMKRRVRTLWAYALSIETLIQREKTAGRWFPFSSKDRVQLSSSGSLQLIANLCQSLSDFQATHLVHLRSHENASPTQQL